MTLHAHAPATLAFVPNNGQHSNETGRYYRVTPAGDLGKLVTVQGYAEWGHEALRRAGWRRVGTRWQADGYVDRYYIDAYRV